MENNLLNFYLQRKESSDRRRQNMPVDTNRRSGEDRRIQPRLNLDMSVKQDYEKLQKTFAAFEPRADQFIKQVNTLDKSSLKNKEVVKAAFAALSPITPIRRISSMPDNVEDGNYTRAVGLAALMLINLPEDGRDLRDSAKQIASKVTDKIKYEPSYNYKEYQHTFSFFKGTLLEPLLKLPGKAGDKIATILHKADKTMYDTPIGDFLGKVFKFDVSDIVDTGKTYGRGYKIYANKFEGKAIGEIVARGLTRIPVLSVITLGLLEIPAICKAVKSGKDGKDKAKKGFKQTLKALIYVPTMLGSIGVMGGWLSKKGITGSLVGMGIGSVIGVYLNKLLTKPIDKVIGN